MPRRKYGKRGEVLPDPKYGSRLVNEFVNGMMRDGKKSVAGSILYESLDLIGSKSDKPPLEIFAQAVEKVRPLLEVKSRRVGGATYQVPVDVAPERRTSLAIRWLIQSARLRPGKSMKEKLAMEFMDAAKGEGGAIKKKEDTHRMAEANKVFAHYRW